MQNIIPPTAKAGPSTTLGADGTMLPGITITEDALVAAGSVVARDVPARKIVHDSPMRIWRDVPPEQLLENQ